MKPKDLFLYNLVKNEADNIYKKNSAYKSGYIQKRYQDLGGKYIDDNKPKKLQQWYKEKWIDINSILNKSGYPTYRPQLRVNKSTPKTIEEIPLKKLNEQYKLKQIIKDKYNLPKF